MRYTRYSTHMLSICIYQSGAQQETDGMLGTTIIGEGFNKGVTYKSVGRNRETIQDCTELKASKNCSISTSRPDRMREGRVSKRQL